MFIIQNERRRTRTTGNINSPLDFRQVCILFALRLHRSATIRTAWLVRRRSQNNGRTPDRTFRVALRATVELRAARFASHFQQPSNCGPHVSRHCQSNRRTTDPLDSDCIYVEGEDIVL